LEKQLSGYRRDPNTNQWVKADVRIIVTTIQKLSIFVTKSKGHPVANEKIVIIFDECHRSQFGEMHSKITRAFRKYHLFGFTGTPIFAVNAGANGKYNLRTTEQAFGDKLHTYTIVDAINDKNVLPFRVDYVKTIDKEPDIDDEKVWDIDRDAVWNAPERIEKVVTYILDNFNRKTYRNQKSYEFNSLLNIQEVASSSDRTKVEEVKQKLRLSGFNSIFCVSSVEAAK
jgi:type I restriction enzyme R subunit